MVYNSNWVSREWVDNSLLSFISSLSTKPLWYFACLFVYQKALCMTHIYSCWRSHPFPKRKLSSRAIRFQIGINTLSNPFVNRNQPNVFSSLYLDYIILIQIPNGLCLFNLWSNPIYELAQQISPSRSYLGLLQARFFPASFKLLF